MPAGPSALRSERKVALMIKLPPHWNATAMAEPIPRTSSAVEPKTRSVAALEVGRGERTYE